MDELGDNHPMEVTGHTLDGWRLEKNRHSVGEGLFPGPEEAKSAAGELCPYPLKWVERGTNPEGVPAFQGGHPDMMDHDLKHRHSLDSTDGILKDSAESELIRMKLGDAAWWDRWYVEPQYSPVYSPVVGAVRPIPTSHYYVAPMGRTWAVWLDGRNQPVEISAGREDAIQTAGRLALGFKTARAIREGRLQAIALFLLLSVVVLLVIFVEPSVRD